MSKNGLRSWQITSTGVDILQKEDDFEKEIFGMLQGKFFGFQRENQKKRRFQEKKINKGENCGLFGSKFCYLHHKNANLL